jgi:hypothetical protein
MHGASESALSKIYNKLKRVGIYTGVVAALTAGALYGINNHQQNKQKSKQRMDRATKNARNVEKNDQYRSLGTLQPTSSAIQEALRERDNYEEYLSRKLKISYNLSNVQLEKLQEPFLTWYQKNQRRYIRASQESTGDPIIYSIHDFINEKGDVFGIDKTDYM